jgi:DNA-binding transcriptional MocR family regulator
MHTVSLTEISAQVALTSMLNDGYLQKHAARVERELSLRRQTLIYDLKRAFGPRVNLPSQTGGLVLAATFNGYDEKRLIDAARQAHLLAVSTRKDYSKPSRRQSGELLLYFAGQESTARAIAAFAARLKSQLKS